jgi:mannose-6-phosphate isomerase-like protein (cupin superfamily)
MAEATAVQAREGFDQWYVPSTYQLFIKSEGAPIYEGSALEDLTSIELADWERRGGKVAYTRMADQEGYSLQIGEIPPGGSLKPEHHMYDAVMLVLRGRGVTNIWQEGERPHTVEWQEGSLLAIPLNAWHQEFNASGTEPARFVMATNMAQMMNHYHNNDFIFNNPYVFKDRYSSSIENFYSEKGTHWNLRLYETNFIPDVKTFGVDAWADKGFRTSISRISMASTSLGLHILDIGEGTYATAHRHDAGAHVINVGGTGYELLYFEGEEPRRVPLRPYGVIAPKRNEFHQHFNTGKGPMRHMAIRGGPARYGSGQRYDPLGAAQRTDPNATGYTIGYEREDPKLRDTYYQELAKNGVELRLPPVNQGPS